jgi:hypothetical protein
MLMWSCGEAARNAEMQLVREGRCGRGGAITNHPLILRRTDLPPLSHSLPRLRLPLSLAPPPSRAPPIPHHSSPIPIHSLSSPGPCGMVSKRRRFQHRPLNGQNGQMTGRRLQTSGIPTAGHLILSPRPLNRILGSQSSHHRTFLT